MGQELSTACAPGCSPVPDGEMDLPAQSAQQEEQQAVQDRDRSSQDKLPFARGSLPESQQCQTAEAEPPEAAAPPGKRSVQRLTARTKRKRA